MSSQEVNSRCEAIYNGFDCTRQDVFAVECLRNSVAVVIAIGRVHGVARDSLFGVAANQHHITSVQRQSIIWIDFFHGSFIAVRVNINEIDAVMLIIFFQSPIECQCIHAVFDVIHLCEHIKVNFCAVLVEFIQISSGSFAQAVLFIWRNVPAQIQLRNNHI